MEEWKDIIGYEGLYQVSNYGRVKHLTQTHKNRFGECVKQEHIVGYKGSNGYMYVVLHKNNIPHTVAIHSLVAKAFIPNPNGYDCINHKDESHDNNRVDNLEWCTKEYNNSYGTLAERKREIMLNHPKTSKAVRGIWDIQFLQNVDPIKQIEQKISEVAEKYCGKIVRLLKVHRYQGGTYRLAFIVEKEEKI